MTLEELKNVEYLGDGVYIGIDSLGITWIVTYNGIQTTNAICLEPEVLGKLATIIRRENG